MKIRNIFIIICSFFVIISAFLVYFNFIKNKKIDENLIMIDEILPVFYEMTSIDSLLNDYNFNYPMFYSDKSELGLGYTSVILEHHESAVEVSVYILSNKNNNIINYNTDIYAENNIIKTLDKKYKLSKIKGTKPEFSYYTNKTNLRIKHRNIKLYETYIDDYYNYFQINKDIIIPKEIKNDYEILMKGGIYGYRIGFGGIIPKEREALNRIMELNDKNILLATIASPYSEGRIYAIEGLFKNRIDDIMNENEYTDILNKIIALNCNVTVGKGCVISEEKINSLEDIKNLIYDITNNMYY
jgi:hypothetical protein